MTDAGVTVFAAFGAGVASFSSPCVLPLVPSYLSVLAGLDVTRRTTREPDPQAARDSGPPGSITVSSGRRTGAITRDAALFVAGFGTVFVLLGLSASSIGRAVLHDHGLLIRISGVVVVAMALFLLGTVFLNTPGLYREWRLHPRLARLGPFAAPVAGAAFAFGWTPCVGPILASVLALSADQSHVGEGALLLGVYSLGLGAPFLAVAVFFEQMRRPLGWLRRHGRVVTVVSASGMAVMGVLLVLDRLASVTTWVQQAL